jgi:hypothetical protein
MGVPHAVRAHLLNLPQRSLHGQALGVCRWQTADVKWTRKNPIVCVVAMSANV